MPPLYSTRSKRPSKSWKFTLLFKVLGVVGLLLIGVVEVVIGTAPVVGGIALAVTLIVVTLLLWRSTRKYREQNDP